MKCSKENTVSWSNEVNNVYVADNGRICVEVDLAHGVYACTRPGFFELSEVYSAFRWQGREYHTGQYESHVLQAEPQAIEDAFGRGIHWTIRHESSTIPTMEQHFYVYEDHAFFLTKAVIASVEEMQVRRISVFKTNKLTAAQPSSPQDELHVLRVPYDNDKWVRYTARPFPHETESYEVTALFQPESRNGLLIGSITHDVWKTGIRIKGERADQVDELELYGGTAGEMTRDVLPHGYVIGTRIESPLVLVGFYEDYRDGLEEYGWANTCVTAPLPWAGGVPFGWNSWAAAMSNLDYDLYTSTSDFLKNEIQPLGFENNQTLYINFDAFWDRFTKEEMEDALRRVRNNGHLAGTYWTPFAFWGSVTQFQDTVEGTNGQYTYADILLRDDAGEVVADIAGGLAIDPTHPGTLARIDWFTQKMIAEGFSYVKLDFMAHGALEGRHYHPEITTGIAAYNYGLSHLAKKLSPEAAGQDIFVNLSIAPMFPYAYAHSRRISCDVFGTIQDTEYLLNSVTHGWWMNQSLYRYNDPDHAAIYRSCNQEPTSWHEGRSRFTASVIAGTVLLLGDDYRNPEAAERAKAWLGNQEMNGLARLGRTFRPVEGNFGDRASDVFVLDRLEDSSVIYLAVFNFSGKEAAHKSISLERVGLESNQSYRVWDIWEGVEQEAVKVLQITLEPAESKIYKIMQIKA
ncbi:alpha-galactosidase [Paenibacillus sp. GCM10027629]|uniref:alpha-galactosidase n=1 Tax=Paenibacillus sp. GCM10027629 TaxID=3273414 RepID=UPI00363D6459